MRAEIARLHARLGTTMIYVTHDQVEAMTLASRIVVLNGGRIEQIGTPLDLYHRPANRFVAGFLGSPRMNFLAGRVAAADEHGFAVEVAGARLRFAHGAAGSAATTTHRSAQASGIEVGQGMTLGVRAENVRLAQRTKARCAAR